MHDIIIVILYHRFCMISYYSYKKVCETVVTWEDSAWYHIWYHVWYQSYKMISYYHIMYHVWYHTWYYSLIILLTLKWFHVRYHAHISESLSSRRVLLFRSSGQSFPGTALQCKRWQQWSGPKNGSRRVTMLIKAPCQTGTWKKTTKFSQHFRNICPLV